MCVCIPSVCAPVCVFVHAVLIQQVSLPDTGLFQEFTASRAQAVGASLRAQRRAPGARAGGAEGVGGSLLGVARVQDSSE